MAAESVLGLSEVRPPLLDHLPHAARRHRRRTGCHARRCETGRMISAQAHMNTSPSADDDDDEVLEDEEFDEDAERDDDDEDADDDDEEEEETWQVLAS